MRVNIGAILLTAALAIPANAAVIFTTLGPGGSFNTVSSYGTDGQNTYQAFLFRPTLSGTLNSITVALAHDRPPAQTRFQLFSGPLPAPVLLETFLVDNNVVAPAALLTMNSSLHPSLTAGMDHWITIQDLNPADGFSSLWAFNNQGIFGTRFTAQLPTPGSATMPAFQVDAAVPEPSTSLPLGLLAAVLGVSLKKRRG